MVDPTLSEEQSLEEYKYQVLFYFAALTVAREKFAKLNAHPFSNHYADKFRLW